MGKLPLLFDRMVKSINLRLVLLLPNELESVTGFVNMIFPRCVMSSQRRPTRSTLFVML